MLGQPTAATVSGVRVARLRMARTCSPRTALGRVSCVCLLVVASRVVAGEPLIVGREPRRGPGTAVDRRDGARRRAAARRRRAGRALGRHLARRQRARRVCGTDQPAAGRRQGPVEAITGRTAPRARPPRHRGRSGRGAPVGVPPGRLQRLLAPRRRPRPRCSSSTSPARATALAIALPPGIHVLENRALGETSPKVDLVRDGARRPPPTDGDEVADAFRRVLADHRNPEGEERPNAANCVHLETFGTRSSCIVRVRSGTASPRLWVADGPPCTTAYEDVSWLWDARRSAPAQSRTSGL